MVTANIDGQAFKIPERFTLQEWRQLQKWDFDNPDHWPLILESITGMPSTLFEQAEEESLILFIGFVVAAMNRRQHVQLPEFDKLMFGQFVDLDCFLSLGVETHCQAILDVLNSDVQWASEALNIIEQYIMWRTTIYRKYQQLFGLNDKDFSNDTESDEDYIVDPSEVSRGWYAVIVELADSDILKMDRVTEEPLEKVLTFLQIKKAKDAAEAQAARNITK
jgi:hypothetical protein